MFSRKSDPYGTKSSSLYSLRYHTPMTPGKAQLMSSAMDGPKVSLLPHKSQVQSRFRTPKSAYVPLEEPKHRFEDESFQNLQKEQRQMMTMRRPEQEHIQYQQRQIQAYENEYPPQENTQTQERYAKLKMYPVQQRQSQQEPMNRYNPNHNNEPRSTTSFSHWKSRTWPSLQLEQQPSEEDFDEEDKQEDNQDEEEGEREQDEDDAGDQSQSEEEQNTQDSKPLMFRLQSRPQPTQHNRPQPHPPQPKPTHFGMPRPVIQQHATSRDTTSLYRHPHNENAYIPPRALPKVHPANQPLPSVRPPPLAVPMPRPMFGQGPRQQISVHQRKRNRKGVPISYQNVPAFPFNPAPFGPGRVDSETDSSSDSEDDTPQDNPQRRARIQLVNYYDYIPEENQSHFHNPNVSIGAPAHPCRILMTGATGQYKTNLCLNTLDMMRCFQKIHVFCRTPSEQLWTLAKEIYGNSIVISSDWDESVPDVVELPDDTDPRSIQRCIILDDQSACSDSIKTKIRSLLEICRKKNCSVFELNVDPIKGVDTTRRCLFSHYFILRQQLKLRLTQLLSQLALPPDVSADDCKRAYERAIKLPSFLWLQVDGKALPGQAMRIGFDLNPPEEPNTINLQQKRARLERAKHKKHKKKHKKHKS